jgi:hypothetical protein
MSLTPPPEPNPPVALAHLKGLGSVEVVKILLHPSGVVFNVDKAILSRSSPVFKSHLEKYWKPGDPCRFIGCESGPVQSMLYWMHYNTLRVFMDAPNADPRNGMNTLPGRLAIIYVLGQTYQMPAMQDDVIDAFRLYVVSGARIPTEVFNYVLGNVPGPRSRLRCLLAQLLGTHHTPKERADLMGKVRPQLFLDAISLLEIERNVMGRQSHRRISVVQHSLSTVPFYSFIYHVHEAGREWCVVLKDYYVCG